MHALLLILISFATCLAIAAGASRIADALMRVLAQLGRLEFRRHVRSRTSGVWLIALFLFALAFFYIPALIWGVPLPHVHDEFSYLLAGDTFAHGRLTNPMPELAPFFETMHVLVWPTYASKFPPGQGLSLAIGYLVQLPIAGVWLALAAACTAIGWALGAIMPKRWAILGAALAVTHQFTLWWATSYWGGGVAMLGGALLLGSVIRLSRRVSIGNALLLGAALTILANSRPLEGLLTSIILCGWLARSWWKRGTFRPSASHAAIVAGIVLVPVFAWMTYYNWRVTGHALRLPYAEHQHQYMSAPLFYYQRPVEPPPEYRHVTLEDFFARSEMSEYRDQITASRGPRLGTFPMKWKTIAIELLVPIPIVIALAASLCAIWKRRRAPRWIGARWSPFGWLVFFAMPTLHMFITPWFRPSYVAPIMPLFFMLIVIGLRYLSSGSRASAFGTRWWFGAALSRAVVIALIVAGVSGIRSRLLQTTGGDGGRRAAVVEQLNSLPQPSLVIVAYGPKHNVLDEWVYNGADIANAKVIFARSMGELADRKLIEHFPNRRIWIVLQNGDEVNAREFPREQSKEPDSAVNLHAREEHGTSTRSSRRP